MPGVGSACPVKAVESENRIRISVGFLTFSYARIGLGQSWIEMRYDRPNVSHLPLPKCTGPSSLWWKPHCSTWIWVRPTSNNGHVQAEIYFSKDINYMLNMAKYKSMCILEIFQLFYAKRLNCSRKNIISNDEK